MTCQPANETVVYDGLLKPLLFTLPPAWAHSLAFAALGPVEHASLLRATLRASVGAPPDDRLRVRAMGLTFSSPLGLAGGFDKNARRPAALAALGFGHLELGTVTARAQPPNPRPNLFRLPADRALVNRLGFPNDGAQVVAARVKAARAKLAKVPLGVSIGKSRAVDIADLAAVIADYSAAYSQVREVADFVVVNVSSPNTAGLRSMQAGEQARALLASLKAAASPSDRLLVKIAPDLDDAALDALLGVIAEAELTGVVATNTTLSRAALRTSARALEAIGTGGLSGPPLRARAQAVVQRARAALGPSAVVIGVGGVENAGDALAMMRAGADLVQTYTGFVYGGPAMPSRVLREMAAALSREGIGHVSEIVGKGMSA